MMRVRVRLTGDDADCADARSLDSAVFSMSAQPWCLAVVSALSLSLAGGASSGEWFPLLLAGTSLSICDPLSLLTISLTLQF